MLLRTMIVIAEAEMHMLRIFRTGVRERDPGSDCKGKFKGCMLMMTGSQQ